MGIIFFQKREKGTPLLARETQDTISGSLATQGMKPSKEYKEKGVIYAIAFLGAWVPLHL